MGLISKKKTTLHVQKTFLHIALFSTTTAWNFLPTRFMEKNSTMRSRSLFAKFHPGWTYVRTDDFCQDQNFLDA